MQVYTHKVHYYETDKMGIVHHSNYIRWMEEARVHYLDKEGWNFARLESLGILSPVIEVDCKYKHVTKFDEEIDIEVRMTEFRGVKMKFGYLMKNAAGDVVCEAESVHGFLDENGRPIRFKTQFPEMYQAMLDLVEE